MSNTSNSQTRVRLMSLPRELKIKILAMSCTHDSTIMPHQIMPGSSKFSLQLGHSWSHTYGILPRLVRKDGARPSELSAFNISIVSKEFHSIVDGDKLFYAKNEFEFSNTQSLLDYLVALKSDDRNAIRSIKVKYDYHGVPAAAFTMLAVCHRLVHLTLNINGMTTFFNPTLTHFSQAAGYIELLVLRGLKSVEISYGSNPWTLIDDILERIPAAWISQDKAVSQRGVLQLIRQIEKSISDLTTQPRSGGRSITAGELGLAMQQAGVNVWGDTINNALIPPGQANSGVAHSMKNIIPQVNNAWFNAMAQTPLSEQEQWAEIDRTNVASWDI